jgi:flagellar P-ring protein precursor FlgI
VAGAGARGRIKEVASVQGVRTNQLVGYGLVVGLDGTGDQNTQAPFATQSLLALLQQMGVTVPPGQNMQLKNLATVMVTAQLPAFAQPGQTIDVNVSSLANAKSLRGGTLIATPLKGADGQIYAMAQGNLIVGGAGASAAGSKVQINHLSAGRIPEGATVERAVATPMNQGDSIQLDLNSSDYSTAREVVKAINARMGPRHRRCHRRPGDPGAHARVDRRPGGLHGRDPEPRRQALDAGRQGGDQRPHRLGGDEPGGDAGGLRGGARQPLGDDQHHAVGQPADAVRAHGQTAITEKADITITQQAGALVQMAPGAKLADVVKALNTLGATPQDLLAILQAMKTAGALMAELEVI